MTNPVKILLPFDGSANAERAAKYTIALAKSLKSYEIHLLNVQPSVGGGVAAFVGKGDIEDWHRDEAEKALINGKRLFDMAGLTYTTHIGVGDPGDVIANFAKKLDCGQIIMGTRGLGTTLGLLLGSVAQHVVSHVNVPVTLIK